MDPQRLKLHTLLLNAAGNPNVYFQPPANVQMLYPCIVYQRDTAITKFAGNNPYSYTNRYLVTSIDRDPDSVIPRKIAMLPMCVRNRFFIVDGLNHDVFHLYF